LSIEPTDMMDYQSSFKDCQQKSNRGHLVPHA
jgi:hypothetical protein